MEMVEEAFHPTDCMGGIAIRWSSGEKMDYVAFATAEVITWKPFQNKMVTSVEGFGTEVWERR
ncbi:MAG: hypothetical protein ACTS6P_01845 [Candidatus Hodgkinia cicadicola]